MFAEKKKGQAALEYLMTYGWAILIIVIVIAVLTYEFGGFAPGSFSSQSCTTQSGIACVNPVMNTSGYMAANFSSLSEVYAVNAVACTTSTATPTNFTAVSPSVVVTSPGVSRLTFKCPVQLAPGVNITIGTSFQGYIWIMYNTQTQNGLIARLGSVSVRVSTTSPVGTVSHGGGGGGVLPTQTAFVHAAQGATTFNVVTTGANQLIVFELSGIAVSSTCGNCQSAYVDGNSMTYIINAYGEYSCSPSCYFGPSTVAYYYMAPTAGSHVVSFNYNNFYSQISQAYGFAFKNVLSSGISYQQFNNFNQNPYAYNVNPLSGNSVTIYTSTEMTGSGYVSPGLTWYGSVSPLTAQGTTYEWQNCCYYAYATDSGSWYYVSQSSNSFSVTQTNSHSNYYGDGLAVFVPGSV